MDLKKKFMDWKERIFRIKSEIEAIQDADFERVSKTVKDKPDVLPQSEFLTPGRDPSNDPNKDCE